MEKENIKGSYLQYFPQQPGQHRRIERPKMLPHIVEEYQYRITNHLLIKKIISPKRDKIIVNSLHKVKRMHRSNTLAKHKTVSREAIRTQAEYEQRYNSTEHRLKTAEGRHKASASFSSAELVSSLKQRGKLTVVKNQLPKQDSRCNEVKSNSIFYRSLHQKRPRVEEVNETFGCGPTILSIVHLQIISFPSIKRDVLMQLELVQKSGLGQGQEKEEKVVRTHPIAYESLPKKQLSSSRVKFALKASKIGDFVPLRVWKYSGVECKEVGTLDIPLSAYRFSLSEMPPENDSVQWQTKQGAPEYGRLVFRGEVSCQLRRSCAQEAQAKITLQYRLYSKRFARMADSLQA